MPLSIVGSGDTTYRRLVGGLERLRQMPPGEDADLLWKEVLDIVTAAPKLVAAAYAHPNTLLLVGYTREELPEDSARRADAGFAAFQRNHRDYIETSLYEDGWSQIVEGS